MFAGLRTYPWVLPVLAYKDKADLVNAFDKQIIAPAEAAIARQRQLR